MNENHSTINVKSQIQNPDSIFAHYQKLVQMRKELDVIAYGSICPLAEKHPGVFAYMREYEGHRLLVVNNFYAKECSWESGLDVSGYQCMLSNYPKHPGVFAYMREYEGHRLLVVNNFYAKECSWESGLDVSGYQCMLSNYPKDNNPQRGVWKLRAYESMVWYQ